MLYDVGTTLERFHAADTESVCDALPIIPARRGALMGKQPSEVRWWAEPRKLAADFRTALATDLLKVPGQWMIVSSSLADAIDALSAHPYPRTPVVLVDHDLRINVVPRAGDENHSFVALDVPVVGDRVDRLRTSKKVIVFACAEESLPPAFRLSLREQNVFVTERANEVFLAHRGIRTRPRPSAHHLDGCTELMRRVREGDGLASISDLAVEERDAHGFTPLHHAVEVGNVAAARRLLEAGADADALSSERVSPADVASFVGSEECLSLLEERGANLSAGMGAAQSAALSGQLSICLDICRKSTASLPPALVIAIKEGHSDLAVRLVELAADHVSFAEAMKVALMRRRADVALAILSRTGLPETESERATMLQAAVRTCAIPLVEAMLDLGVQVDVVASNKTALEELVGFKVREPETIMEMVRFLLERGADPARSGGPKGRSAIEIVEKEERELAADPYATEAERDALRHLADLLRQPRTVGGT